MYLLVGLGNPGRKYSNTRHNAGFMVADVIANKCGASIGRIKFKSLISDPIIIDSHKVVIIKPQTYMNLSGEAVLGASNYFGINPSRIIVIYDDKDFDFGKIKLRYKGSSGSHNGMDNIIYHLHDEHFPRIKIGIGRPQKPQPLRDYVTQNFSSEQLKVLPQILDRAADAAISIITEGIDNAMNIYNVETN